METRRRADSVEQFRLRRGHPNLPATFEPGEKSGAPLRVEVRGDFVEEQERRLPPLFRDKIGMREDEAEEQRFLLARRGLARRHLLGPVRNLHVLAVRPDESPSGRCVAAAALAKLG